MKSVTMIKRVFHKLIFQQKSFSPKQLAIEYVIAKVFVRHCCDIVVTDRLKSFLSKNFGEWANSCKVWTSRSGREMEIKRLTKWKIEFNENERVNKNQAHAIITTVTTRCKALERSSQMRNLKK